MAEATDNAREPAGEPDSVSAGPDGGLPGLIARAIDAAGGWLPFDRFMALALYAPGLGYYSGGRTVFGAMPASGSDFVTAPELSPLFGRALAVQVAQALAASGGDEVFEFGAGSGALAAQLIDALDALGAGPARYTIVELSGPLRARQRQHLARFGDRVRWVDQWPEAMRGVVLGNEVLDAMPVQLVAYDGRRWRERGVVNAPGSARGPGGPAASAATGTAPGAVFAWADRDGEGLAPPVAAAFVPGTVTERHPQARAFIASLAARLVHGFAFFIDYGFPEAEYYHPQRTGGTLMCHRAHRADTDPLGDVGAKDITAHVDFTGIALAGQDAGLAVAGYTSQAAFLLNCGLAPMMAAADAPARARALKLVSEHEMGELFKVIAFATADLAAVPLTGFSRGDRTHRL